MLVAEHTPAGMPGGAWSAGRAFGTAPVPARYRAVDAATAQPLPIQSWARDIPAP